ncbi:GNAT family N-acetyltransferase [Hamadaea tsunoensis]|uniref:GNAT family N-acetyltransferase n=1 Tax=Hamadaea tsunoensis TaxID=53368 RepID=UPI0003F94076|nr:GNAT family N-acetyltransferase [Hamadaea tsunoensis]
MEITDAPDLDRFEARVDGELAGYLEYARHGGVWAYNHAFTFPEFRGRGIAAEVTRFALDAAEAAGVRVRAVCPFVADYLAAHPGYAHLKTD